MKLLLHICCSNCTLYPYKILKADGIDFTGFWFNPNIHPLEEYYLRLNSMKKLAREWDFSVIYNEEFEPEKYFNILGLSSKDLGESLYSENPQGINIPAFPDRCSSCYDLRLDITAAYAKEHGFDSFSTTLLISPYQDFDKIISTGNRLAEEYSIQFHAKDYRPYFRDAMELSKELDLYRQKYCGCIFSKMERNQKKGSKRSRGRGVK